MEREKERKEVKSGERAVKRAKRNRQSHFLMRILDIPDIGYIHLPSVTEFSETDIGCTFLGITAERFFQIKLN